MGAFELQETAYTPTVESHVHVPVCGKKPPIKDESIVAFKVYDSCRRQNCLTPNELGPARSLHKVDIDETAHKDGDIIRPPRHAASVTIDQLKITRILIVDKQPSPFRNGFWDVDIKYVFEYRLTFREVDGCVIMPRVDATNSHTVKSTLFGSIGNDLVVGTDLFKGSSDSSTFAAAPFIWVEAKAVALDAKLYFHHGHDSGHGHCKGEVLVTIGLFSILKLFRLVHLNVQSTGFVIPEECDDNNYDVNPCEYFADLDFPMDIFAPPQRKEFMAGLSENVPHKEK